MLMSTTGETEVEKLLRMAKKLRAQAEESEKEIHVELADKKAGRDGKIDELIDHLCDSSGNVYRQSSVVERLRKKKPSLDTLEKLVDRLDYQRDVALGNKHVQAKNDKFVSVSGEKNEIEAERLNTLTDVLLNALEELDGEFQARSKTDSTTTVSKELRLRLSEKRRERSEKYQERQESLREAQTIKKGQKYELHDENQEKLD
jgi:hypothetical protein